MIQKHKKTSLQWLGIGLLITFLFPVACKKPTEEVAQKKEYTGKGKEIFNNKGCVACHDFSGTDKPTGPSLKGVTKRVSVEWLQKWLKNPDEVKKTDKYAQELDKKFPTSNMVNLGLTDQEINDIIDYLKWMDTEGSVAADFKPLSPEEFERAKKNLF
ncbi:MAG: hypothetical protein KatS3mg129_3240 [Leptospiraceae bacterium]|nr:MAG: hypothetical protein KatS3mg129_3240 [Leptospiraceae bacterium]